MALATWWQDDSLPILAPIAALTVRRSHNKMLLATLVNVPDQEIEQRFSQGHVAYLAYWHEEPIAYGWVATKEACIGELDVAVSLSPMDQYLWDFATLEKWRGRGIYPRLLQAILMQQRQEADRFWILYAPENRASAAGILKAGFQVVSDLSFTQQRTVGHVALQPSVKAQVGAVVFGLPLQTDVSAETLAPCWHCGSLPESTPCWPNEKSVEAKPCTC